MTSSGSLSAPPIYCRVISTVRLRQWLTLRMAVNQSASTAEKLLMAVDLSRHEHGETRVEIHSVGRSETFLNGPDGSTFGVCCNHSFTLVFGVHSDCTTHGETRHTRLRFRALNRYF